MSDRQIEEQVRNLELKIAEQIARKKKENAENNQLNSNSDNNPQPTLENRGDNNRQIQFFSVEKQSTRES